MKKNLKNILFCFLCVWVCVFFAAPSISWCSCSTEEIVLHYDYLNACGHTQSTSFTLAEDTNISRIRIWYDTDVGGDTLSATLSGPDGYSSASGTILTNGQCQWNWCEAIWNLDELFKSGTYTLTADSNSVCSNPSGQTTLILYGCTPDTTSEKGSDFKSSGAVVTDLRFFESGGNAPPEDEREFATSFSKSSTKYIYYQLSLSHPALPHRVDINLTARIYKSDGSLYGEMTQNIYILPDWETSWHLQGWGWEIPGNWPIDTYTLKLFDGADEIVSENFSIVDNASADGLDLPDGVVVVDATANPADAPVYIGNVVTGGSQMELSVNFPAYNKAVDIWIGIQLPDGRFYFVDESGKWLSIETSGFPPIITGVSNTTTVKQVLAPFDIGSAGAPFNPWPDDGTWTVYWLIAPDNNGNIIDALDNGNYELGTFRFEVKSQGEETLPGLTISDYFPQSGPPGSYVLLNLENLENTTIPLTETLTVFYNQKELEGISIRQGENILQFTVPADAQSGDIQVKSGNAVSNIVPFSVLPLTITPLISQSVSPSTVDQIVNYEDTISVTLPPGILDSTRTLSISKVENAPANASAPFTEAFAFDVSIEGLEQLNDYIEIKVKYNQDLLDPEYPVEDQLVPMRWNSEEKFWLPLPYQVDITNQTLNIYTDHLCILETVMLTGLVIANVATWSGVGQELLNDVYVTPQGNFRLLYNKSAIQEDATLEDTGWSNTICPNPIVQMDSFTKDHPKSIQDMGNFFETALKNYVDSYKFKDPITKPGWLWGTSKNPITVKIDSWWVSIGGDPNYEKIWEIIHIPTNFLKDYTSFMSYGTIGHELFHRMQAEYYTLAGFKVPANLWWMEASAEYAGYRAAWSYKSDKLHERTGWDFLSYPISKTGIMENKNGWKLKQSYEYAASAFIQFLVEKKGFNFKDMMQYVSGGSPIYTPLEMLNGYKEQTLSKIYREFAAWGIWGSDSFLKEYKITTISEQNDTLTPGRVEISFTGGTNSSIDIYKFDKEYVRALEIPQQDCNIKKDESYETTVDMGNVLYLLASNPGKNDETLNISIKKILGDEEQVEVEHTFNLKGGYSARLWEITTPTASVNLKLKYKGAYCLYSSLVCLPGWGAKLSVVVTDEISGEIVYQNDGDSSAGVPSISPFYVIPGKTYKVVFNYDYDWRSPDHEDAINEKGVVVGTITIPSIAVDRLVYEIDHETQNFTLVQ